MITTNLSLQRQSKALTRIRSWSRCDRSLLSTPGTASRFNRYDERCRGGGCRLFGGDKHTTVLLARLRHHAHMLTTKGSFYRTSKRD